MEMLTKKYLMSVYVNYQSFGAMFLLDNLIFP